VLGVCFRFFIARNSTVTPSLKFTLARRFLAADYPSGRWCCAKPTLGGSNQIVVLRKCRVEWLWMGGNVSRVAEHGDFFVS
jgi:hypothetical protein